MSAWTDRTREFHQLCGQLGPSQPSQQHVGGNGASSSAASVNSLGDFHQAASGISREIYTTSQKLAQLTRLVQRGRSLFNDPAQEISQLVHGISEDIKELNGKLEQAEAFVAQKRGQLGKTSQVASHSVQVVGELKSSLVSTAKTFKEVVKQRSENVRVQQERKAMFGKGSTSKLQQTRPKVYGLPRPNGVHGDDSNGDAGPGTRLDLDGAGGGRRSDQLTLRHKPRHVHTQMQQMQEMQLIPDQSYLESRATAMTEIEAHVLELGEVFNRLGQLVEEHTEMTERIGRNVEEAAEQTEAAHLRLLRTLAQYTSNRSLAMKVSAVVFLFFLLWVVFLV